MAIKPETRFTISVNNKLSKHIPHIEKMHNEYRGGTWDVWYSGDKGDCWIEYKYLSTLPIRRTTKPMELLSALQIFWGLSRHAEGRRTIVIVGCASGGLWLPTPIWQQEFTPDEFYELLLTRQQIADKIYELVGQGHMVLPSEVESD